ncbi:S-adenosylmethionine:tRNA ribosyltransferase-isomerase [Legionella geestiana]|uniref:S-adenosylmethionine:tRNA ribosyltransferase-isomerase n=1 Tax=Legionella geestiana TaxID=45065 RepID=A0A0W0TWX2_9GAMM|nr:tRNA preQ1(34) S-adenosylmethionine ribosyltransferase-isomerase QueA [Legionella geestiana]KTC99883.1 S-adenosylmethionine:tRNA ribosyltransferase-isomerase [Legionella geestiana]QBS13231.1 tRNA preQ1(34) S-adenosylmethionine ribosyltransferase-isomerase QueA [Legionella geestiana]STX54245.1 S-adenosylmethionine:tRNA ribosyltransferase-isomerase [Legionella geestiana]
MQTRDFHFELPEELIAQYPLPNRTDSRLLCYERATGTTTHTMFSNLLERLVPGDVLVLNDSRVIPARMFGQKASGGRVEILLERITGEDCFLAHIRGGKSLSQGARLTLEKGSVLEVTGREGELFCCRCTMDVMELLHLEGHIPLPPYIHRPDESGDFSRYQTVYARVNGSVAAPTAGLHFDEALLASLRAGGVEIGHVTLHVGAGTFQPVRSENIHEHVMHREQFEVSEALCDTILRAKAEGRRVIAVGTTAMRSLESAARDGVLKPMRGDTDIFIFPGFQFNVCDGLLTNFHLPQSTLLMLVSAFIGHREALALYEEAVRERYRFFSYGDTSLLL